MILGVMSDTHGNTRLMLRAADQMRNDHDARWLIHLGDNWEDQEWLSMAGYPARGVPGLWCPEYGSRRVPRRRIDDFSGMQIAYAHTVEDLPAVDPAIELLLAGHTHRACICMREGIPLLNPGHLKNMRDRGCDASYGIVAIEADCFHLALYLLNGDCVDEKTFRRRDVGEDSCSES
ncbi:MAG: hypothetical protein GX130_11375 [Candidatus Hydrogenedens sp.]|nr:hypothetical protein [Candidatus Hydrogenedens sp.]